MADIVSIHDDMPSDLPKGQKAYYVDGFWAVTSFGEPSPVEVRLHKLSEVLDTKAVVTKEETKPAPTKPVEIGGSETLEVK